MNYHDITTDDMLNGDGLRVVLWVSGCEHHCPECQNPVTWDPKDGKPFDKLAYNELMIGLSKDYISGLTISGGDPLYPDNVPPLTKVLADVKLIYPEKNVWVYTGYNWDDVKDLSIMRYIDVLVDGRFDVELQDSNYPWAGSTNQKVIDVKKSISQGKVILYASN